MRKMLPSIGAVALLVLGVGAVQGIRRTVVMLDANQPLTDAAVDQHLNPLLPRTPQEIALAQRNLAEEYRYKGTRVVASRNLDPDDVWVSNAIDLLTTADFIPVQRVQRFAGLDSRLTVVRWHLTIEALDVREHDTLVHVRAAPILRAPGQGAIGVLMYRPGFPGQELDGTHAAV